jgi:hypothetical protein
MTQGQQQLVLMRCCDGPRCDLEFADPRHGRAGVYNNHFCRCQPCKDAFARVMRNYLERHPEQKIKKTMRERAKRGAPLDTPIRRITPSHLIEHGTVAGYNRHRWVEHSGRDTFNWGPMCEPCRNARNEASRVKEKKVRVLLPCGTWGAYQRHRRDGDPRCEVCLEFVNSQYRKTGPRVLQKGLAKIDGVIIRPGMTNKSLWLRCPVCKAENVPRPHVNNCKEKFTAR